MLLEANYAWNWDGSSGAITPAVEVGCGALYSAMYVQCSTIASTLSVQFQTAPSSAGPWFTEGASTVSATASATSQDVFRLTGPYQWMRPYSITKSTGTHVIRLFAVG